MNEVRIFCMNLVRTDGLELWQRLAVLGAFCESLSALLAAGKQSQVRDLLDTYIAMVQDGLVKGVLDELQPDHGTQAVVFSYMWASKLMPLHSPTQNQISAAIAAGLGIDSATGIASNEQLIGAYTKGIGRLHEALRAAPQLLEHYVMNEMFMLLFPFDGKSPFEAYLKLISRFGLLRLMLAAQCNTDGALPDAARLAQTVQVFCRRFQHDTQFARQTNNVLTNAGMATLEKLYTFLRN
jgi:lysine-N-methylase